MQKILIATEEFPPFVGGAGSVAFQNARQLGTSAEVDVFTRQRELSGEVTGEQPFSVRTVKTVPKVWALPFAVKLKTLNLASYDAIILNDIGATYAAGLILGEENLKKSIVYIHGAESEQILSAPTPRHRFSGIFWLYRRAVQCCRRIIAVSEFRRDRFVDVVRKNSIEKKISVVYAGVDRGVFYPDPMNVRERHNVKETSDILLSASRLVKRKGYEEMLKIFAELHRTGHSFHWIIAGDGPYRETLLYNVEREGVSDRVTWVGEITQDVLRQYYSAADLFWLLSKFKEAFGLVYLEANACGTPVIGRDRGGVGEAIRDGTTGFLVSNAEECKEILAMRQYQDLETDDVLNWVEDFGVERTVQRLREIIDQVAYGTDTVVSS